MSAIEQDLQDYLLETDETAELASDEHFRIDTLEKAEWAMRKLAQIARQEQADLDMANREIERIDAWLQARRAPRERSREFFEGLLQQFHHEQLLQDPRMKTIKLPHGALKARKVPDKWEYNEQRILEWAHAEGRNEVIRTQESVIKDAVKQIVKEDGEAVPGVTVLPQGIKYLVEVDS